MESTYAVRSVPGTTSTFRGSPGPVQRAPVIYDAEAEKRARAALPGALGRLASVRAPVQPRARHGGVVQRALIETRHQETDEPVQYVRIDVPGDGSCLFHSAIVASVAARMQDELRSESFRGRTADEVEEAVRIRAAQALNTERAELNRALVDAAPGARAVVRAWWDQNAGVADPAIRADIRALIDTYLGVLGLLQNVAQDPGAQHVAREKDLQPVNPSAQPQPSSRAVSASGQHDPDPRMDEESRVDAGEQRDDSSRARLEQLDEFVRLLTTGDPDAVPPLDDRDSTGDDLSSLLLPDLGSPDLAQNDDDLEQLAREQLVAETNALIQARPVGQQVPPELEVAIKAFVSGLVSRKIRQTGRSRLTGQDLVAGDIPQVLVDRYKAAFVTSSLYAGEAALLALQARAPAPGLETHLFVGGMHVEGSDNPVTVKVTGGQGHFQAIVGPFPGGFLAGRRQPPLDQGSSSTGHGSSTGGFDDSVGFDDDSGFDDYGGIDDDAEFEDYRGFEEYGGSHVPGGSGGDGGFQDYGSVSGGHEGGSDEARWMDEGYDDYDEYDADEEHDEYDADEEHDDADVPEVRQAVDVSPNLLGVRRLYAVVDRYDAVRLSTTGQPPFDWLAPQVRRLVEGPLAGVRTAEALLRVVNRVHRMPVQRDPDDSDSSDDEDAMESRFVDPVRRAAELLGLLSSDRAEEYDEYDDADVTEVRQVFDVAPNVLGATKLYVVVDRFDTVRLSLTGQAPFDWLAPQVQRLVDGPLAGVDTAEALLRVVNGIENAPVQRDLDDSSGSSDDEDMMEPRLADPARRAAELLGRLSPAGEPVTMDDGPLDASVLYLARGADGALRILTAGGTPLADQLQDVLDGPLGRAYTHAGAMLAQRALDAVRAAEGVQTGGTPVDGGAPQVQPVVEALVALRRGLGVETLERATRTAPMPPMNVPFPVFLPTNAEMAKYGVRGTFNPQNYRAEAKRQAAAQQAGLNGQRLDQWFTRLDLFNLKHESRRAGILSRRSGSYVTALAEEMRARNAQVHEKMGTRGNLRAKKVRIGNVRKAMLRPEDRANALSMLMNQERRERTARRGPPRFDPRRTIDAEERRRALEELLGQQLEVGVDDEGEMKTQAVVKDLTGRSDAQSKWRNAREDELEREIAPLLPRWKGLRSTDEGLTGLAILHNPDQVAGGEREIPEDVDDLKPYIGPGIVNSALGGTWGLPEQGGDDTTTIQNLTARVQALFPEAAWPLYTTHFRLRVEVREGSRVVPQRRGGTTSKSSAGSGGADTGSRKRGPLEGRTDEPQSKKPKLPRKPKEPRKPGKKPGKKAKAELLPGQTTLGALFKGPAKK